MSCLLTNAATTPTKTTMLYLHYITIIISAIFIFDYLFIYLFIYHYFFFHSGMSPVLHLFQDTFHILIDRNLN